MIVYSDNVIIAKWQDRFIAWLVDFTVVSLGIGISIGVVNHFDSIHS